MMGLLFLSILLIIIIFYLAPKLYTYVRGVNLLNQIPGPKGYPIIGSSLEILFLTPEERLNYLKSNFKKYGTILKLITFPKNVLAIADANAVESLFSARANAKKSFIYHFLEPLLGKTTFTFQDTSKNSEWSEKRKILAPIFNSIILSNFLENFASQSQRLLKILEEKLDEVDGFNICPYMADFAISVLCETIIGLDRNDENSFSFSEFREALSIVMETIADRIVCPWNWPQFIYYFTSAYKKVERTANLLRSATMNIIRKKKANRKQTDPDNPSLCSNTTDVKRKVLLDFLLDTNEKSKHIFSDEEITDELTAFIVEGYETVSASLSFTLFLLGSHQDIQDKVIDEMDQVLGSLPPNSAPTMNQVSQLKYLDCVIKESLRLFPPAALVTRTTSQDLNINNYTIPANSLLIISIFHIHHNPIYYPDPDSFNPENFSEERTKTRYPFAFLPFSAGPRNCVGQKYAMLEMKVVLAMFLRRYKVISLDKREDISLSQTISLHPTHGISVRISERK